MKRLLEFESVLLFLELLSQHGQGYLPHIDLAVCYVANEVLSDLRHIGYEDHS